MLDAGDGSTYKMKFFSYVVGGGLVGHRSKLFNQGSIHDNMPCFSPNGNTGIGVSNMQRNSECKGRGPILGTYSDRGF